MGISIETLRTRNVIIGFKQRPTKSDIDMIVNLGGVIKRVYTIISAVAADISDEVMEIIRKDHNVKYVEIDEKLFAHIPIGVCQEIKVLEQEVPWGINRIGSRLVNAMGNTGQGIRIAILDTGVDGSHEDLSRNYKGGYDFVNNITVHTDDNGHGTHIAGIIAAEDNDIGVVGVAPDAHIYSVKVLDYAATGTASDIIAGLEWSLLNKMNIINMSLGASEDSVSVQEATNQVYNHGILIVAAAGNNGNVEGTGNNIDNPAKYTNVIAVGAIDRNDKRAKFSSTGPKIELVAPGKDILSTLPGNKYGTLEGTSMASPYVAGVAALVMKRYPEISNTQIRIRLQITTQDISNGGFLAKNWFGYGLVDVVRAVTV